ncbi:MAG: ribonuclease III [Alphaproteobacteria bacterium]|nr:ribonuclease III [Alphaproteobacteria bacterium]
MESLEKIIGYEFTDKHLLEQAITHSSISSDLQCNYERLEFLGDRILGVSVADMLFRTFKKEPEGYLSPRLMALVCKETVAEIILHLGIDKYIHAEGIDIKNNANVLCDVGEAIIGAIYIDSGAKEAFDFVYRNWHKLINTHTKPPKDAKTALQEIAHAQGIEAPIYTEVKREGSEHDPVFFMQVDLAGQESVIGSGHNKKNAEQNGARKMLQQMGVTNVRYK